LSSHGREENHLAWTPGFDGLLDCRGGNACLGKTRFWIIFGRRHKENAFCTAKGSCQRGCIVNARDGDLTPLRDPRLRFFCVPHNRLYLVPLGKKIARDTSAHITRDTSDSKHIRLHDGRPEVSWSEHEMGGRIASILA
jgi:hypothetical protein